MSDRNCCDVFGEEYFLDPDVLDTGEELPEDFFDQEKRDLLDRIDLFDGYIKTTEGTYEPKLRENSYAGT